jgi:hypothetical protein
MTSRRHVRAVLAFLALAPSAGWSPAAGQQEPVGRVERIAQLLRAPEPVTINSPSMAVQIRRGADEWLPIGPNTTLYLDDGLRVQRYVNVRLQINRRAQRGRLTFLPEVLLENGGRVFDVGEIDGEAHYEFPADTTARNELAVAIQSGALVIDWRAGRLRIHAAGHDVLITHTRVLFALDATGDAGWLFVEDGAVSLPAFDGMVVRAGELARLQRGLPPTLSVPAAQRLAEYQNATEYHANRVWSGSRPFWARPAFYVPAVGIVAGATVFAVTRSGRTDDRPGRGTVIIRFPF